MSDPSHDSTDPSPSELGSRDYWERFYGQELANWEAECSGGGGDKEADERGEVWFGHQAEQRLVAYVKRLLADGALRPDSLVVDVGCGNGHLALRLAGELGLTRLLCLDYSAPAVELTRRLAEKAGLSDRITVLLLDVTLPGAATAAASAQALGTSAEPPPLLLDKGTYDAISLCRDDAAGKRAAYRRFAAELISPTACSGAGRLVLASCNWTETELLGQFGGDSFVHLATLPGRAFRFGGAVGADVTTVVLTRGVGSGTE